MVEAGLSSEADEGAAVRVRAVAAGIDRYVPVGPAEREVARLDLGPACVVILRRLSWLRRKLYYLKHGERVCNCICRCVGGGGRGGRGAVGGGRWAVGGGRACLCIYVYMYILLCVILSVLHNTSFTLYSILVN